MRKTAATVLVVLALLLAMAPPSQAWSRHGFHGRPAARVFVGVGPVWWGPGWWGPPYWYYPPVVYAPPPVVIQEPPVYVEAPRPAPPTSGQSYWYFCQSANGYYPSVASCPEPWIKVAPR